MFGAAAAPFEARLEICDETAVWTVRDLQDLTADRIGEFTKAGMSLREIAEETGIARSTVHLIHQRLRAGELGA